MQLLLFLSIIPAYLVGSFFIKHDPGPLEPKRELKLSIWFGVIAIVIALILSFIFSTLTTGSFDGDVGLVAKSSGLPYVLVIAVFAYVEEIAKFVPIAVYLHRKPFFNEHTDGIIYFATVGLTFGAVENFLYGFGLGGAALVIVRLVVALFFHGALTSLVGYVFARAHIGHLSAGSVVAALFGAGLIHTLYNFFAFGFAETPILILAAAVVALATNIAMFWLYFAATDKDVKLGLAGPQFAAQRAQEQAAQYQQAMQQLNMQVQPQGQTVPVSSSAVVGVQPPIVSDPPSSDGQQQGSFQV